MTNSVYAVNKGINKSIEFRGLRAQYIAYLGAGILGLLIIYAGMYLMGLNSYVSLLVIGIAGAFMVMKVYALSSKYGEFGMMKAAARRGVPKVVSCRSRAVFMEKR